MFLVQEELKTVLYDYQLGQITEDDNTIVVNAIAAAEEEVRSYLSPGILKSAQDGRPRYDVSAILSATGSNRNVLILEHTKNIAVWWIIRLCNADLIFEQAKQRYDASIKYLEKLRTGEVVISSLPVLAPEATPEVTDFYRAGSRRKFNHED